VHVFTLANVLRRPLVIYGDEQAAAAALSGIFLPLLWPDPSSQCSRQPVAVLYGWSHFSLLCTVAGEGPATPPLLPLSTRDGPLQPRFLTAEEEAAAAAPPSGSYDSSGGGAAPDPPLRLLRRYLDAERLFNGTLGVRLSGGPRRWAACAHAGGAAGCMQLAAQAGPGCADKLARLPRTPAMPFMLAGHPSRPCRHGPPPPHRGAPPPRAGRPAGQHLLAASSPSTG
jgi:hypothetical protein